MDEPHQLSNQEILEKLVSSQPRERLLATLNFAPGLTGRDIRMICLGFGLAQPSGWTLCAPGWYRAFLNRLAPEPRKGLDVQSFRKSFFGSIFTDQRTGPENDYEPAP